MALAVIRYESMGQTGWGAVRQGRVQPLCTSCQTTGDFIRGFDIDKCPPPGQQDLRLSAVTILSPITRNQQFVCLGANYRQHMIESGIDPDVKRFNMVFTKAPASIVAFDSDLVKPRCVRFLDYEIELGLVIRKPISSRIKATDDNLGDYIAGIVMLNDYSARDIQIPQGQFYKGKSFRTFAPIGPYLCLLQRDEMHYLRELQLTLTVNGEVRQQDCTSNLVFGPAETLTELSGVHDFSPGDLIATGTPAGCALTVPTPLKQRIVGLLPERKKWELFLNIQARRTQYLKAGDVVESRIHSTDMHIDLGVQRNLVVEEN